MPALRSLSLVVGCTLLFAGVGGGIGAALGWLNPGYYHGVFRDGRSPNFDPVAVGLGTGVGQGAAGGAVVGALLAAAHLLATAPHPAGRSRGRRLLTVAGTLAAGCGCLGTSFVAGCIKGGEDVIDARYWRDRQLIDPLLGRDPAFAGLRVGPLSGDQGFVLHGRVPNADDLLRLRAQVTRLFGGGRERDILAGVGVGPARR